MLTIVYGPVHNLYWGVVLFSFPFSFLDFCKKEVMQCDKVFLFNTFEAILSLKSDI